MDCFNPDGSLATTARTILTSLFQPGTLEDIAVNTNLPAHRIRPCLEELMRTGLAVEKQGKFQVTDIGIALLNS